MCWMIKLVYVVFILFLLLVESIKGKHDFKKFCLNIIDHNKSVNLRKKYYKKLIFESWIVLLLTIGLVVITDVPSYKLGLKMPNLHESIFPSFFTYGILIITTIYIVLIIYQMIASQTSQKFNEKIMKIKLPADTELMIPRNEKEKKLWIAVSISAGIVEEFVYRGFLIYTIMILFPNLNFFIVLLIGALVFGIGHLYQGVSGIVQTGLYGLFMGIIYLSTDSLVICMILHFLTDCSTGIMFYNRDKNMKK